MRQKVSEASSLKKAAELTPQEEIEEEKEEEEDEDGAAAPSLRLNKLKSETPPQPLLFHR